MLPSYLRVSILLWSLAISCLSVNRSSSFEENAFQEPWNPLRSRRCSLASYQSRTSYLKYVDTTSICVVSSGMWDAYIRRYLCNDFHHPWNLTNLQLNVSSALTGSHLPVSCFCVGILTFFDVWANSAANTSWSFGGGCGGGEGSFSFLGPSLVPPPPLPPLPHPPPLPPPPPPAPPVSLSLSSVSSLSEG